MNMKRIRMVISVAALLACIALVGACGGGGGGDGAGGSGTPLAFVIKGPVYNATVTYSDNTTALTATDGSFPYKSLAVTTSGGTYMDMNGERRLAPNMAAPANMTHVTPLTTLYTYADAATRSRLETLMGGISGIDTAVTGSVTAANALVAKMNESLGEALTQLTEGGYTPTSTYLAGLATAIGNLTPAAAGTGAGIAAAVTANTVAAPVVINTDAVVAIANDTAPGDVVQPVIPANNLPVTIDLTTANVAQLDASLQVFTFNVHPTTATFTYNVANFAAGDKLVFDAGTAITIINANGADGLIDVVCSLSGKSATVHLTGIAPASDGALFSGGSFNTVFGAGSLSPYDVANVSVAAANAAPGYNASTVAVKFAVHPTSTFAYNIVNFEAGDKLVFDDGTAVGLTNTSGTDGLIDVVGSLNGNAVVLHLAGIAPASDSAIIGVNAFNSVFGAGSLVNASGDVIVQPADVSVIGSNAAPYDASTGAIVFSVHPTSSFTYNIANFAAGDKLVFDAGTAVGVTQFSATADGEIDIFVSLNQQAVRVHLTGIAPASDAAIFGVNSFNTVFGEGSLSVLQ